MLRAATLELSHFQSTLKQRLINAQDKLDPEFGSVQVLLVQNEVDQQEDFLSFRDLLNKMGWVEAYDFIVKSSFSLQKIEHLLLGEKIYATSEMNSINYILQNPSRDLVVFDIDDTLISSLNPFYDVHGLPNTPLNQRYMAVERAMRINFYLGLLTKGPWTIIESQTQGIITDFQSHGIKVIALTALWPIIKKDLDLNIPSWRVSHLKELGYDFSKSFPVDPFHGFHETNSPDADVPLADSFEPYFKKGVIFSGDVEKKDALLSFLRTLRYKPKSVLFVDDVFSNVHTVYWKLKSMGIDCHSILYTRTRHYPANSMFSIEEYNSHLQKQEESVKKLLSSKVIYKKITQNESDGIYSEAPISTPPHKAMTWVAPGSSSPSLSNVLPKNKKNLQSTKENSTYLSLKKGFLK